MVDSYGVVRVDMSASDKDVFQYLRRLAFPPPTNDEDPETAAALRLMNRSNLFGDGSATVVMFVPAVPLPKPLKFGPVEYLNPDLYAVPEENVKFGPL